MKICLRCRINKEEKEFAWENKKEGKLTRYCRSCHKEYSAAHYKKNSDMLLAKTLLRRQNLKMHFQTIKETLSCMRCEELHPSTLDFHHRDPSKKEMNVSSLIHSLWPISRINEEIKKCDILCSNCHRKLHWEERQNKID